MRTAVRGYRLSSIDMLRGLAIVVMAIDHVRDYVMLSAEQDPTANASVGAALFFTRWITHFCAPVFVCLAGVSAGLMTSRRSRRDLATFLFARGLWLVFVEMTIVSLAWTFAPLGMHEFGGRIAIPLGVIWAIGVSLIVLAAAQWLGHRACLLLGAAIVAGHNLLDPIWPATGGMFEPGHPWWVALHAQMSVAVGPFFVISVYPVVPWIGVMLLGFGIAPVFQAPAPVRDKRLLLAGATATAAFIALRLSALYGDPNPWTMQPTAVATLVDLLNVTKYPPSLLFALMTLGPAFMVCSVADRLPSWLVGPLVTFGRVPFAFYVAHLYLIHAIALLIGLSQGFAARQFLTFGFLFPKGFGFGLPGVYLVWALVVLVLYPFCRWVAAVKARRRDWWLSYL